MNLKQKKTCFIMLAFLLGFCLSSGLHSVKISDIDLDFTEYFNILEDNSYYTEIRFNLPKSEFIVNEVNSETYLRVFHPEANYLMDEGYPELPIFSGMIAIPNTGDLYLEEISYNEAKIVEDIKFFPSQGFDIVISEERGFLKNDDFYTEGNIYPQEKVVIGTPAIMRDFRVIPVTFQPYRYDPLKRELIIKEEITIRINYDHSRNGENELISNRPLSRSFKTVYRGSILNFDSIMNHRNPEYQQRSILIIYPNTTNTQYLNIVNQFSDWKRRKGFHVVSTSTSGMTSNSAIKNYIQNAYNTWEHPPEYVVLMGATSGSFSIPGWSMGSPSGAGDHNYTTLDGNDIIGDIFIGRFPATSAVQLQTMWNKQLGYEKYPYMANTEWYERGVISAHESTSSGISIVYVSRYIRDQMLTHNPDYDITVINSGEVYSQIVSAFNQGVMTFAFRGFMMSGWNPDQTNNFYMLPNCFLMTCFTYPRAEDTIRAGTPATPKGGITAVGMSTGSTKTAFNNIMTGGFYYGMYVDGARTMGETLHLGKQHMYNAYANAHYNEMTNFFHWTSLFGDPSMDIWLGVPKEMNVDYQTDIPHGQNFIDVFVTDSEDNPIVDAWVTIRKMHQGNETIFETGYTDANGMITLYHPAAVGDIDITVTKPDYHPHLGEVTILDEGTVSFQDVIFNTDLNSGTVSQFFVSIKNYTDQNLSNVSGVLSSQSEYIEVISNQSDYSPMAPGQISQSINVFSVAVSQSAPDYQQVTFDLNLTDGINEWFTKFSVNISGSKLEIADISFDQTDIINPGQTTSMYISLHNSGSIGLEDLNAVLSSSNDLFTINNPSTYFGDIPGGQSVTNSGDILNVTAFAQLLPGMIVPLELNIFNEDGYDNIIYFTITIGEQTVTDPLGPDSYGYWCYDDGDLDYFDAPVYDWIEINPAFNGSGSNTGLTSDFNNNQGFTTMNLPFTFRFYGVDYDEITICANGWISFGEVDYGTQRNWLLPGPLGPHPIIAAFWDNLSLQNGGVYTYFDPLENIFIIQWCNTQNIVGNHENTFQIILYDPQYYPIFDGNGPIKIQYKVFNNVNNAGANPHGNWGKYCTIGIADHTNTVGLQYTFNNEYPTAAKVLENESAIYFTGPPVSYDDDYLILNEVNVIGNNTFGSIYPGENFNLNVVLMNYGQNYSENITGTLVTDDMFIEIYNSTSPFTNIPSGLTGLNTEFFTFSVDENTPENRIIPFNLYVSSDTGSWEYSFNLTVQKPDLQLTSFLINDFEGNNNGVADPGEDIKIILNLKNNSSITAEDLVTTLNSNDPYITINNSTFTINEIPSERNIQAVFDASISSTAPVGSSISLDFTIISDQLDEVFDNLTIGIGVSPEILEENFDTWLPEGWSIDAHASNWSQSNTSNAGGSSPEARLSWSPSFVGTSRLISNPINLIGATNVSLEFRHSVNNFSGGYTLGVATRSNNGDWTTIWDINVTSNIGAQLVTVPIDNDDLNNPDFQVCWFLQGNSYNLNYWYIDDVFINATIGNSAIIQGNVFLDSNIYNVEETIISAGEYGCNPLSNGEYTLYVNSGEYENLNAWLPFHNNPYYSNLELSPGDIFQNYDFSLSVLTPPSNLTAQQSEGLVNLSWTYTSGRQNLSDTSRNYNQRYEFEYFKVYRQHYTGVYVLLGTTIQESFVDNINPQDEYNYYVTAFYTEGESMPSNIASVPFGQGDLPIPYNLTAFSGEGYIELNWEYIAIARNSLTETKRNISRNSTTKISVNNKLRRSSSIRDNSREDFLFQGFNIYKNNVQINDTLILENYFQDTHVIDGNNYSYYVTAVYDQGESFPSNTVDLYYGLHPTNISIELSSHTLSMGESFTLAISVSEMLEEWSITAYGFQLFYDQDLLEFTGIPLLEFANTLSAPGGVPVFNDIGGQINIGWAHFLPIITQGDILLVLEFEALNHGMTQISMDEFIFNTYDIHNIGVSNIDISQFMIGDINRDGVVTPMDASIILQYYVGYDPIPEIDPSPWSDLSIMLADVDLNGAVQPMDASFILQYYVGIIDELPVQLLRSTKDYTVDLDVVYKNGFINFYGNEDLLGLGIEVKANYIDALGSPEITNSDWLSSHKIDNQNYKIGLARAEAENDNTLILSLPVITENLSQVEFTIEKNNLEKTDLIVNLLNTDDIADTVPAYTKLKANYPNPFNPETNIEFSLKEAGHVNINVYNLKGQKVRTLINEAKEPGYHNVIWDGMDDYNRAVGSGIFFYLMKTENYNEVRRMVLLK